VLEAVPERLDWAFDWTSTSSVAARFGWALTVEASRRSLRRTSCRRTGF